MHRWSILLVISAAAVALAGCSSSTRPEFTAAEARIIESSPAATVVDIRIKAVNKGPNPLPLSRVEYTVEIDGKPALSAVRSAQITAHRFSEESFVIPAVVEGTTKPTRYRVTGNVTFVPSSLVRKVLYDEGWIRPTQSFAFEGPVEEFAPPPPARREVETESRPTPPPAKKPAETPPK